MSRRVQRTIARVLSFPFRDGGRAINLSALANVILGRYFSRREIHTRGGSSGTLLWKSALPRISREILRRRAVAWRNSIRIK